MERAGLFKNPSIASSSHSIPFSGEEKELNSSSMRIKFWFSAKP